MGFLLLRMEKFADAQPYQREAMEGRRRILGDDHPATLGSIHNVAQLLYMTGKYAEAEPLLIESFEGRRRVLGDKHPETLYTFNNMGELYYLMGKYAQAEPYFRKSLEDSRIVLGDDHPETLTPLYNLGHTLNKLERYDDAVELLQAGESAWRRVYAGASVRWLGSYLAKMGEAHIGLSAFAEAERYLLEAHDLLAAGFGAAHKRTVKTINLLITVYDSMATAQPGKGYDTKAAQWRAKLEEATDSDSENGASDQ